MKETVQEYVQRIQSKIQGKDPLQVQAATAKKLGQLLKRASPSKLRKRPAPDNWSVTEILAHLSETEIVASIRFWYPNIPIWLLKDRQHGNSALPKSNTTGMSESIRAHTKNWDGASAS